MFRKLLLAALIFGIAWYFYNKYTAQSLFFGTEDNSVAVHQVIVEKIESMGKLELVKYQLKDIVEYTKTQPALIPDSKATLLISGEAVGCIDLSKIDSNSVTVKGDTVYVKLPEPEVCYYKIDHANSKVVNTNFFTYNNEAQLIDAAYKSAEKQLLTSAIQSNIIEQTRTNATKTLKPLLETISGKTVILTYNIKVEDVNLNKNL